MKPTPCPECRAIHQELQEAFATVKEHLAGQNTTPVDLASWLQGLDEDECARMRETSAIWTAWLRWQEHRIATGHWLSMLPLATKAIGNPN